MDILRNQVVIFGVGFEWLLVDVRQTDLAIVQ
jgi:hypothetical protein